MTKIFYKVLSQLKHEKWKMLYCSTKFDTHKIKAFIIWHTYTVIKLNWYQSEIWTSNSLPDYFYIQNYGISKNFE